MLTDDAFGCLLVVFFLEEIGGVLVGVQGPLGSSLRCFTGELITICSSIFWRSLGGRPRFRFPVKVICCVTFAMDSMG